MARATLIYDSDCGFCRWCLGKVLAWDRRRAVRPLALGTDEANRLLRDLPRGEQMSSWHLVDGSGAVHSAGAGFSPLLRLLPAGAPFAALAARLPEGTERAYRLVSGNRSLFGRLVSDGAKRRADRRIAERAEANPQSRLGADRGT
jgi:predicted DCC family thiol-disulfide oxidoreductase YuxK